MVREYTCVISIILNALSFLFMAQDMVYLHICQLATMDPLQLLPLKAPQIFAFTDSSCLSPFLSPSHWSCPSQCNYRYPGLLDSVGLLYLKPALTSVAAM